MSLHLRPPQYRWLHLAPIIFTFNSMLSAVLGRRIVPQWTHPRTRVWPSWFNKAEPSNHLSERE